MDTLRKLIDIVSEGLSHMSIQEIERKARDMGIHLGLQRQGRELWLSDISRDRSNPATRGNGAKIMTMICKYADAEDLTIALIVDGGEGDLIEYYENFGFESSGFGYEEGEDRPMRRIPE